MYLRRISIRWGGLESHRHLIIENGNRLLHELWPLLLRVRLRTLLVDCDIRTLSRRVFVVGIKSGLDWLLIGRSRSDQSCMADFPKRISSSLGTGRAKSNRSLAANFLYWWIPLMNILTTSLLMPPIEVIMWLIGGYRPTLLLMGETVLVTKSEHVIFETVQNQDKLPDKRAPHISWRSL